MRNSYFYIVVVVLFFGCKEPEARRPKQHTTTNFYKELIAKNKQLINRENAYLSAYVKKDTINEFKPSTTGFWYSYNVKVEDDTQKPKVKDNVVLEFDITSLDGDILYPKQQITYKVDKEDFIPGLQDGIKLMKKGETITFVIPSHRAFGVAGDGDKIGINQPIKSKVTLIEIK